jgi:hypothetical protein
VKVYYLALGRAPAQPVIKTPGTGAPDYSDLKISGKKKGFLTISLEI